jgi:hypothetical protein
MKISNKKFLENLIEQILDATGKPVSSKIKEKQIVSNVDIGKMRNPVDSGFCEHNPKVNQFAQANPTQMFIVLAFVFFTIQKEWVFVTNYFEDFVKWLFEDAIPKDDWDWRNKSFSMLGAKYGTGKDEKFGVTKNKKQEMTYQGNVITPEQAKFIKLYKAEDAAYIAKIWKNKDRIYDFIMSKLDKPEEIYLYIINNISGLGPVKAAFSTQLILGKFGCIDSINQKVYKNVLTQFPNAFDDKGTVKNANEYLNFLKALEDLYNQDIAKTLWDDWCEIVENRILYANEKGENKQIQISFANGDNVTISGYKIQRGGVKDTSKLMSNAKKQIGSNPTGRVVSRDHLDAVANPAFKKYYESFKSYFEEACWKNYKQVGMKKKGNKMVPNCIPKKKKKKTKK